MFKFPGPHNKALTVSKILIIRTNDESHQAVSDKHYTSGDDGENYRRNPLATIESVHGSVGGQLEGYVKRLEKLESIALEFEGVDQVYALQAGREVRVIVDPGGISDLESRELSRQIARKLEEDLQYPGQIQVTVIREFRATDYAR